MTQARRAQLIIAGAALTVGMGGLIIARDLPFTASRGEILLGLGVSFNPLGALVTIALSGLALGGALRGRRLAVSIAAWGYALATVQVLVQFGRDTNWLGTRGSNLSFHIALALGLWSLVWLERQNTSGAEPG